MNIFCRFGIHDWLHIESRVNQYKDTGNYFIHNFWKCKRCKKLKVK